MSVPPNASNSVRGFSYPGVTKDINNIINNNTSNHNRISITHLLAFSQHHMCQSINQSQPPSDTICVRTQGYIHGRLDLDNCLKMIIFANVRNRNLC